MLESSHWTSEFSETLLAGERGGQQWLVTAGGQTSESGRVRRQRMSEPEAAAANSVTGDDTERDSGGDKGDDDDVHI